MEQKELTLELKGLTKRYGDKTVLNDLHVMFHSGVYGILGPNGAGKSTMMGLLTDTVRRTDGEILFQGEETLKLGRQFRARLGYMPQQQGMYDQFTARRFLFYTAGLKGLDKKTARRQIEEYLNMVGLADVASKKLGGYSGGMRQRIMFVAALLGDPDILILDEPTAGLDPEERIRIRNYISEISENRIVLLATHVVADIECIAEQVLLIREGKLLQMAPPHVLLAQMEDRIFERICRPEELHGLMQAYPNGNISQRKEGVVYRVVGDDCPDGFIPSAAQPNLEDVYLYYLKGDRRTRSVQE